MSFGQSLPFKFPRRPRVFTPYYFLRLVLLVGLYVLLQLCFGLYYDRMTPTPSSSSPIPVSSHNNFHSTAWPPLRKTLCGKGYPNLFLAGTLFRLAREEPLGKIGGVHTMKSGKAPKLVTTFFEGSFGASTFCGTNCQGGKFSTLYVQLLKCSNDQIRHMEEQLFVNYTGIHTGHNKRLFLEEALNRNRRIDTHTKATPPPCIYCNPRPNFPLFVRVQRDGV